MTNEFIQGTPYDAEINTAARKYDIRPALLAGVIQQESSFNPRLTSSAGAQGLSQLMPETARSLGVRDSFDATQSIDGGAKYLSQMLTKFHGDERLALAAYNAGPGNVEKYRGVPPFKETQDYVTIVEANAARFARGGSDRAAVEERARSLEFGSRGSDAVTMQRELGVRADGDFGPQTERAVRSFQRKHELDVDGIVGPKTRAALGHVPREMPQISVAAPARPTVMQTFEKSWVASTTVNPRTGVTIRPELAATLDQKNSTLELRFRDAQGVMQRGSMTVGETSGGRYDAAHILPGRYQLGNFAWNAKGAETLGNGLDKSDYAYGTADIPIVMRDGHDSVPVVLKDGGFVSDGSTERLHGGGSALARSSGPEAPFAPHQPLLKTLGCVRGENEDVSVIAAMLSATGKPIALTITRDSRGQPAELQRSLDGGTTWQPAGNRPSISGRLHDALDTEFVSIVTRNSDPPATISFRPEQLGFTKRQVEEIAARDPDGRISIGLDEYRQPVVNALSDLARSEERSSPTLGAQR